MNYTKTTLVNVYVNLVVFTRILKSIPYAYINRHVHAEYFKMIEFYSPLGIWHVFLYSINTNIYHFRSMKYRQYA